MKIIIKGINVDITGPVEDYLYKKMSSLEKFINDDAKVQVELEKTTNHHKAGDIFRAEAHIWNKSKLSKAEKTSANMYSSIDLMQEELFNVLSNKKDKKITLFRKGAQKIKNIFKRA
ncbi:MAG: ribosome-associated translation inhibitor RaiA [bacterium]